MKLAIDLGGTNIRIAQVAERKCLKRNSVACLATQDVDVILTQLFELIEPMIGETVEGIGIGVPSIVDTVHGIVYDAMNIASWKEVHLKELLEEKFGLPVAVNNDSNCFALGESLFGSGRLYENMVGITIGTGIGLGIIIHHSLYGGGYAGAGELGALPYLEADYEYYCSSGFFKRRNTTGAAESEKALKGDNDALLLWQEFGGHIGQLVKAVLFAYSPQLIVLGGGIATAFPLFKEAMYETLKDFPYPRVVADVKIVSSQLQDAGLLGASALLG